MPPRLSQHIRATIQTLRDHGYTPLDISRTLGVDIRTVRRWFVRGDDIQDQRPRWVAMPRSVRRMTRMLYNGYSLRSVARRLAMGRMTVHRNARRSAANPRGLYPYKIQPRLRINAAQRTKRLAYIRGLGPLGSRWARFRRLRTKMVFDQKPFKLGTPPNRQNNRSWRRTRTNIRTYPMDKNDGTVHCLAAANYWGRSRLYWYVRRGRYQRDMPWKLVSKISIISS